MTPALVSTSVERRSLQLVHANVKMRRRVSDAAKVGDEFQNGKSWYTPRLFSYEWQIQGLQARSLYEWQMQDLEESDPYSVGGGPWREGTPPPCFL